MTWEFQYTEIFLWERICRITMGQEHLPLLWTSQSPWCRQDMKISQVFSSMLSLVLGLSRCSVVWRYRVPLRVWESRLRWRQTDKEGPRHIGHYVANVQTSSLQGYLVSHTHAAQTKIQRKNKAKKCKSL